MYVCYTIGGQAFAIWILVTGFEATCQADDGTPQKQRCVVWVTGVDWNHGNNHGDLLGSSLQDECR